MKHIYLINSISPAAQYGIGTYIKQLTAGLLGSGNRLTIVTFGIHQAEYNTTEENGIRMINIPTPHALISEKAYFRYYKYVSFILELYLNKIEDNIFHFNFLQHRQLALILKNKYPNSHIVVTVHYLNWLMELKGNLTKFQAILRKTEDSKTNEEILIIKEYNNDKIFFHIADKVICLSFYTKGLLCDYLGIHPSKIEIIKNGHANDVHRLTSIERKKRKASYMFDMSEKIILFVGRLDELKGVDHLIVAFKKVLKTFPNTRLVMAGNGSYDLCLKKGEDIWSRITFTGRISKDKLYELYQIADVGVLPSFCEQCSYTIIEMMMHGLPFIATTSTGLKEMVEDKDDFLVTLTENADDISFPIDDLAKKLILNLSSSRSDDMEIYQSRYSLECMKTKTIRLYSNL